MRLVIFNMISVDGFFEGQASDIGWHNTDEEFNRFAISQLDDAGGLLFGRKTYEMMAGYWPGKPALDDDPEVAARMNRLPKYVVSNTLKKASWNNTTLINGDAPRAVRWLKEQSGKDLFIFGSATLAGSVLDLVDEIRLMVNPIVLGRGRPLFIRPVSLRLDRVRPFGNGNVLLYYTMQKERAHG